MRLFKAYLTDPLTRTVDSIPSNQVFIVQVYLLSKMKQLELPSKEEMEEFFLAVEEEEMRRRTFAYEPTVNITTTLYELLNVDTEKYVTAPFKRYLDEINGVKGEGKVEENEYTLKFQNLLKAGGLQKSNEKELSKKQEEGGKVETKPKTEAVEYEVILTKNNAYKPTQVAAIEELSKAQKNSMPVLSLSYLFGISCPLTKIDLTP